MPGRPVCPALGPGGWWTPWHAKRPAGARGGANEVGLHEGRRPMAGSGAGLVGGALAAGGVGHASPVRPDPSTMGVVGERGSGRESCLQLVPGSAGQAFDRLQVRRGDALSWPLEQRPRGVVREYDGADVGEALLEVVVL